MWIVSINIESILFSIYRSFNEAAIDGALPINNAEEISILTKISSSIALVRIAISAKLSLPASSQALSENTDRRSRIESKSRADHGL